MTGDVARSASTRPTGGRSSTRVPAAAAVAPGEQRATRSSTTSALTTLPPQPPGAMFDAEEQAKYRAFKEARRGAADYMAMEGEFAKYLAGRLLGAAGASARRSTDECEIARGRRRLRRAAAVVQAAARPASRRPVLREGRRRRRHLVLEPLSGHRLRRRVVQLPAAAGGDGLHPVDEVRVGLRDPRVLPDDGRPSSASTTTACSTPRSRRPSGTRTPAAGRCTRTAATRCGPGS